MNSRFATPLMDFTDVRICEFESHGSTVLGLKFAQENQSYDTSYCRLMAFGPELCMYTVS